MTGAKKAPAGAQGAHSGFARFLSPLSLARWLILMQFDARAPGERA